MSIQKRLKITTKWLNRSVKEVHALIKQNKRLACRIHIDGKDRTVMFIRKVGNSFEVTYQNSDLIGGTSKDTEMIVLHPSDNVQINLL